MKCMAWAAISLGLLLVTSPVQGQEAEARLERNFPNPFNSETTIPVSLPESLWEDGKRPVVSIRIYNVLAQFVAVPRLSGTGEDVEGLALDWNGTGRFRALWDGLVTRTGREASSGVYVYQLEVNGRRVGSLKMTIMR